MVFAEFADILEPPCEEGIVTSPEASAMILEAAGSTLFLPREPVELGCSVVTSTVLGSMLPLFVHNLNNLMHGVVGNLDLAVLFAEDREKSMAKVDSAQQASARIGEFVNGLGRLSMMQTQRLTEPWLQPLLDMAEMAAGRAVNFSYAPSDKRLTTSSSTLRAMLACMLGAAMLAVRGCGKVTLSEGGRPGRSTFEIGWERAAQQTGRPDRSSEAAVLLCHALLLSAASCGCCGVGEWDQSKGRAAVTVPDRSE
jgi:hypothetical protein